MSIRFACPVCKTTYTVQDQDAAKKSDCAKCGQRLQVPSPSPADRPKTVLGTFIPPGAEPPKEIHWTKMSAPVTLPSPSPFVPPAREPVAPQHEERQQELQRERPEPEIPPYRRRSRSSRTFRGMSVVKLLMLIVTGLWLLGMPAVALLCYVAMTEDVTVRGGYVILENGGLMSEEDYRSKVLRASFYVGIKLPTIPYAIAMVVLGVLYFALKPGA